VQPARWRKCRLFRFCSPWRFRQCGQARLAPVLHACSDRSNSCMERVKKTPGAAPSNAYPWRVKAGIVIVLLMAALAMGTLLGYRATSQRTAGERDVVILDEERFKGLRQLVPARGAVGYLSDISDPQDSFRAYSRLQYFLAPVVVDPNPTRELVVANCASPSSMAALAASHGLTVARDLQNGVALLRPSGR
jgi:hypothetical protein